MNDQHKKVYTMEDNVKSIAFSLRSLVKQFEEITLILSNIANKNDDGNDMPF